MKNILLSLLLVALGFVGGFVVERRFFHAPSAPAFAATPDAPANFFKPKPPARKPAANESDAGDASPKILSLAEIGPALQAALEEKNSSRNYSALQRVADAVAVADIPQVLAQAATIPHAGRRASFRQMLLARWAGSDIGAAMKFSLALPRFSERHECALAVLGMWLSHDAASAAAWTEKLPPGELRNARWSEFDLDAAEWRIPGERMKSRQPHIVPLSTQAVAVLRVLMAA